MVCALFLAVGALMVALDVNQDNAIVDVRPRRRRQARLRAFSRDDGSFTFAARTRRVKTALVNWGIAAVIYLVVGKVLDRIIRP